MLRLDIERPIKRHIIVVLFASNSGWLNAIPAIVIDLLVLFL